MDTTRTTTRKTDIEEVMAKLECGIVQVNLQGLFQLTRSAKSSSQHHRILLRFQNYYMIICNISYIISMFRDLVCSCGLSHPASWISTYTCRWREEGARRTEKRRRGKGRWPVTHKVVSSAPEHHHQRNWRRWQVRGHQLSAASLQTWHHPRGRKDR